MEINLIVSDLVSAAIFRIPSGVIGVIGFVLVAVCMAVMMPLLAVLTG